MNLNAPQARRMGGIRYRAEQRRDIIDHERLGPSAKGNFKIFRFCSGPAAPCSAR